MFGPVPASCRGTSRRAVRSSEFTPRSRIVSARSRLASEVRHGIASQECLTVRQRDVWACLQMTRIFSTTICTVLTIALVAGCEGDLGERLQSGRVLAWQGLQGRWVGPVVPADKSCGATAQGSMSIGDKGFAFDPFQSTTVIQGTVGNDGGLTGNLTRQGGDRQNLSVSFEGSASRAGSQPESIDGTLVSGRCRWKVTLHRG
jgi:hypothetical protein